MTDAESRQVGIERLGRFQVDPWVIGGSNFATGLRHKFICESLVERESRAQID